MRIAYDHQIFYLQEYGGISRYFYEVASGIAKRTDNQVRIVAPLYINSYLNEAPTQLEIIGTRVPRLPRTGRVGMAINTLISRPILALTAPDVVHETYYSSHRLAPKRAKIVLTVYDMIHEKLPCYFPRNDATSQRKLSAVKRADHIICISENTRKDLIELFGVSPEKTNTIHLGFSLIQHCPEPDFRLPTERPYILYVGARSCHKNFDGLLAVFAQSDLLRKEAAIIAFGGGSFSAQEHLRIRELGIDSKQVLPVSGNDSILEQLYRNAVVFVYPSLYEGFGIPPLEAMSFDCPVICSNTSSIPEVVGDAALFFDPSNSESIRDRIEAMFTSPAQREELIERGRNRIRQFSWETCANETLAVYRKVVGQ
jgi:glycosyltransferase involved in cell wall biosynthesis